MKKRSVTIFGACPICGEAACFLRPVNNHRIFHCGACGLEFCNPMPGSRERGAFYRDYSDVRAREDVVRLNARQNLDFLERDYHLDKSANLLDFGCGRNLFVETCRVRGIAGSYGCDPYGAPVRPGRTLSWDRCRKRSWDCITLWGVLEHVTDPVATMTALRSLLRDKGMIVLTTVSTHAAIPYRHKPPEHTLYFTQKSLELLAKTAGLSPLEFRPYTMWQDSDVYLSILLRTVPQKLRVKISHSLDKYVEVPTNEIVAVFKKQKR
jgi:2-polyprenyl-3-methyl-5-hydroxy-6-metoxy-1,4-benzoquinol methylase